MEDPDQHLDHDLRATTENLRQDARQLERLEKEKGQLDADDPRALALADEAERLSAAIARKAAAEKELTERANGDT